MPRTQHGHDALDAYLADLNMRPADSHLNPAYERADAMHRLLHARRVLRQHTAHVRYLTQRLRAATIHAPQALAPSRAAFRQRPIASTLRVLRALATITDRHHSQNRDVAEMILAQLHRAWVARRTAQARARVALATLNSLDTSE